MGDETTRPNDETGERGAGRRDAPGSPWRTLDGRVMYRNPWLSVTEYRVIRPDGAPGVYGVVDPGDNATIVALDGEERITLIGEFRYVSQRFRWMLPSGKIEAGEQPLAAAQRELAEEGGVTADDWRLLGSYPLSDGISTQVSHIFLARALRFGEPHPEGTERLSQRQLPLREAVRACLRGEIADAPSALGIWRTWFFLRGDLDAEI